MIAHRFLARIFYKPYRDILWRFPEEEKKIYLTFDDGPYPPVTKQVLALLKKLKVPATFFLSGQQIFTHRRELKKLNYIGYRIGSHFFHHIPVFGLNSKIVEKEIRLTEQLIEKYFKQEAQLFRPPYGIFNPALLKTLRKQNKRMILWSLMANDFKWSAENVLHHLTRSVRAGDIVVFHDSQKAEKVVLEVLPEFIKYCGEMGLGFGELGNKTTVKLLSYKPI